MVALRNIFIAFLLGTLFCGCFSAPAPAKRLADSNEQRYPLDMPEQYQEFGMPVNEGNAKHLVS